MQQLCLGWLYRYEVKYEGVLFDRHIRQVQPESQCLDNEGEEGIALNIPVEKLMGIWTVVFGFSFLGLLISPLSPVFCRAKDQWSEEQLYRYDQWCNPVENPQAQESGKLIAEKDSEVVIGDTESDTDQSRSVHCKVTVLGLRKAASRGSEDLPM